MQAHYRTLAFIILLMVITIINLADFVNDARQGSSILHLVEEATVISLSVAAMIYLIFNIRMQAVELDELKTELYSSQQQFEKASTHFKAARQSYTKAIREQFAYWHLSNSEQEIALLLLKGLSFKEIAVVRNTKEKTVRQQASQIYTKADVEGRHAFAGWFIEDFLG